MQAYLKRVCGYSLTGDTREHALFFLFGPGANGKSVAVNTVAGILGRLPPDRADGDIHRPKLDRHPTELACCAGPGLSTAVETEEGRRWAEARIKSLTGGDRISARFMRQDFFEFVPKFKLIIVGNHKPGLRRLTRQSAGAQPYSIRRHHPARGARPDAPGEASSRRPGILAWMLEGCRDWQAGGLQPPPAVVQATADYLETEVATAAWIEDGCDRGPDLSASSSALFNSWSSWALANGEPAVSTRSSPSLSKGWGSRR